MRFASLLATLALVSTLYAQSIITPVFVHKDGELSSSGYSGSQKEIYVDGGSEPVVGWISFQNQGVDVSGISGATLNLYLRSLDKPGTLAIYALSEAVAVPENNLKPVVFKHESVVLDSIALSTTDVEKVVQLTLTDALRGGSFYGVALVSTNGLAATFDSKEGTLAPVIYLTHTLKKTTSAWHHGSAVPADTFGNDGDYYLESVAGDVYAKAEGAWSIVTNLVGPAGASGATIVDGQVGGDRIWSSQKIQAELDKKVSVEAGKGLSSNDFTTQEQRTVAALPATAALGDMLYWQGSAWATIGQGAPGQVLGVNDHNVVQWRYGDGRRGSVVDGSGNVYTTVVIGKQEWTVENLRATNYANGDSIGLVEDNTAWASCSTGAYCFYDNTTDKTQQAKWGALYNWHALNNPRGLAPPGWRVPGDADWRLLESFLGGAAVVGGMLKEVGTANWNAPNTAATNSSGFTALPGGLRTVFGTFAERGLYGCWWSATLSGTVFGYSRQLAYNQSTLTRASSQYVYGLSVRLVRDLD